MGKPKNTKELLAYVEGMERRAGNVKLYAGTVWRLDQLSGQILRHNTHNELIKVEVHNRNPGSKERWDYEIWAWTGFEDQTEQEGTA